MRQGLFVACHSIYRGIIHDSHVHDAADPRRIEILKSDFNIIIPSAATQPQEPATVAFRSPGDSTVRSPVSDNTPVAGPAARLASINLVS